VLPAILAPKIVYSVFALLETILIWLCECDYNPTVMPEIPFPVNIAIF